MIQGHPLDASRALASCAGGAPLLIDLATGTTRKLPLFAPGMCVRHPAALTAPGTDALAASPRSLACCGFSSESLPSVVLRGDDAPTGTRRGGGDALGGQAVFSRAGEHAFVGTTKGWLFQIDLKSLSVVDGLRAPGNASVKSLALSKTGQVLLANCGDRTIRTFDVSPPAPGSGEKPIRFARDFKNAVSNVQWCAATLSADSDYVVGSSGGSGEHLLYVWCGLADG